MAAFRNLCACLYVSARRQVTPHRQAQKSGEKAINQQTHLYFILIFSYLCKRKRLNGGKYVITRTAAKRTIIKGIAAWYSSVMDLSKR